MGTLRPPLRNILFQERKRRVFIANRNIGDGKVMLGNIAER